MAFRVQGLGLRVYGAHVNILSCLVETAHSVLSTDLVE